MTKEKFDREDLRRENEFIKNDIFNAIIGAHESKITPDAFVELLQSALILHGVLCRAQILESCSVSVADGTLDTTMIDKAIGYLVTTCDQRAAQLAGLVELIEETKTPGPRH
ncbi:MAG TPA: hypothetical protein VMS08_05520 [Candidatus Saccharimonadia bacterium]|jgi:hypothetical protein|nr:hypothetical protein [Candidatus Saccharimonadia bacterium]